MPQSPPIREVRADLSCRHCGYNLRGLTLDRPCPECGTPVEFSARGFQLRYADPAWISRLHRGTNSLLWAIVIFAITIIASLLAAFQDPGSPGGLPVFVWLVGTALAVVIWARGVIYVASVEPRAAGDESSFNLRKLALMSALASSGCWLVYFCFVVGFRDPSSNMLAFFVCLGLSVVALALLLLHLRVLADRTISGYLRDWITSYLYAAAFAIVCMIAAMLLAVTTLRLDIQEGLCFACFLFIGTIFFSIWLVLILAEFNRELDHCVRHGEGSGKTTA